MSTSGTVTFSVNETDIISDALESIGYKDPDEPISGSDLTTARRKLNMIIKQWTSQIDFAPGLKMWTRRRGYLFLQKNQVNYSIGPSGDEATEVYVQTTLTATAAINDATLTVASIARIASGDKIGVVRNNGSIYWTTVNGTPSGSTVTLTDIMEGGADSGNVVFAYTTALQRPFDIISGVRRDLDENDVPIDVNMGLEEYESIYSKTSQGSPSRLYFEAQRTNAQVYLDCAPEDCTNVIRLVYLSYIEDFSSTADDADFPAEWARALSLQLAMDCCLPFRRPVPQALAALLVEAVSMARKAYPQTTVLQYESDPDSY